MATRFLAYLLHDNTTDANFRSWGGSVAGISYYLAQMGFVQTADTGQINWTTVVKPPQNTFAGYEIWRCANSTNQTNCPIFFRIDFGAQNNVASTPRIKIQIGSGSDGAGALTGNLITAVDMTWTGSTNKGSGQDTTYPCFFSGDGSNYLGILMWVQNITGLLPQFFGFERSLDATGAYTAKYNTTVIGWASAGEGSGATWWQQSIFANGAAGASVGPKMGCAYTVQTATLSTVIPLIWNNKTPTLPVFPNIGYAGNPLLMCVAYYGNDIGDAVTTLVPYGALFNVTQYGTLRTYMAIKVLANSWLGFFGSKQNAGPNQRNPCFALRWD